MKTSSMASVRPRRMRSPCFSDALGHLLAVDERAVARAAVAQHEAPPSSDDLGVLARHVGADRSAGPRAVRRPIRKSALSSDDHAAALRVVDVKTGVRSGSSVARL